MIIRSHSCTSFRTPLSLLGGCTLLLCVMGLSGCMVGPDYKRPHVDTGITFKETQGWKQSSPQDSKEKGPWWQVFKDPKLDTLMAQVQISNQNVAEYAAEYREALAVAGEARANLYPTLDLDGSATRSSTNYSSSSSSSNSSSSRSGHTDTGTVDLEASWEVDLWGKLRRTTQEEKASAQASKADLDNATLSAQSSLAQDYFALRILDRRIDLYGETIKNYERYVQVTLDKYNEGQNDRSDVAEARAELQSAKASQVDLVWQRAQYEHAIAILIGKPPSEFSLAKIDNYEPTLPDIPAGVPSDLLQRRPDIAAAEREVAAANEEIGVKIAGYFPDLTLSAEGGYEASGISKLFSIGNRFWSLGPSLTQSLFDGGETKAEVAEARAAYDAKVASYRQTVLDALGDVEDYLVESRTLDTEIVAQREAANNYRESAQVTYNQYEEGEIDFLDVATAQASAFSQEQSVMELLGDQLTTSVELIVALGGGWDNSQPEPSVK